MTLTNPPYCLQASSHSAQLFREAVSSLINPAGGIIQSQDMTVTQNGTPNMSVNVGAGRCWVPGTSLSSVNPGGGAYLPQGLYFAENDATVNLSISASNPSNPRIDQIIVQIEDAAYAGAGNLAQFAVITGTPTSGASLGNLVGLGTFPPSNSSALLLAYVLVPTSASSIITADIANVATTAQLGLPQLPVAYGSFTFTWPGGNGGPGAQTITHGLGRTPQVVLMTSTWTTGAFNVICSLGSAPGATTFTAEGWCPQGNPALNATSTVYWIAIG